ncbi:type II toxin-antitoxin system RelB/DinJ family antitoxin [Psychrobacter sp. I-STPA6b]|uniref:type II toxin-antitoxin system RelB/DinJ family antitoxin n=1 Tax=Psychrobacter sp. I-STPA6b TaxID=2585718 RepID=UPI001D0C7E3F|nr:type II toxin-antitoxin system RelB/DinJ family antitoxin [Psychrobacter sp. I-STPA6b]
MGHTNFNMRLDDDLRASAYPVLEQYGLTPMQAVRMFFNQIAHTGKVPLSLDWASHVPNQTTIEAIKSVDRGELETYATTEEAMQAMLAMAGEDRQS